ncbi:flavin reductase [[Clostridium] spiroforme]|nr:flavin reductase [Thomasclavelia spiroformis]MBM6879623.1 flavin reductase [Thomasclavelia spiroformis]MBM6930168.1 flavin reductase [Thomasclavelia spiroformis]
MKRLTANMFNDDWALVTAGNKDHYNMMTISWGAMGTIWGKSVLTIYVKPCRYTYEFLENNDYFVVSFFDQDYKKDLGILGSHSGRNEDKLALTSLQPEVIEHGITYKQAKMTVVCKKIYGQHLDGANIPDEAQSYYVNEPVHKMYIGEVVKIIEK